MASVASCATKQTQHATFADTSATGSSTKAQLNPENPHEIWVSGATDTATAPQRGRKESATEVDFEPKLRVAFTKTRNAQPVSLTAKRVTSELIKAAMMRCDQFGDREVAREEMRRQCLEVPSHLHSDLLEHFRLAPAYRSTKSGGD